MIATIIPTIQAAIAYTLVSELATWFKARAGCACRGMELVRVDAPEQNVAINKLLDGPIWTAGNILHRMSMGPNPKLDGWVWHGYGSIQSNVLDWFTDQPDNWYRREFCLEKRSDGYFNDLNCAEERYYVCQYDKNDSYMYV